jgi:propionyl-CoA synthetase
VRGLSVRDYEAFRRSVEEPEDFWAEQARKIHWNRDWDEVLDYGSPPFARWFVGGETNLCYNAVDRHLQDCADQDALVYISTETGERATYTFREWHAEVNAFAAVLRDLGVVRGDRVVIYMPMMAEAIFAMLACVRLGAIHSVVFGGFAATNLATRIDDARPKVLVTTNAGMRGGNVIGYKPLVDEAVELAEFPPESVLVCGRDVETAAPRAGGRALD